jgi:hypothetical protein
MVIALRLAQDELVRKQSRCLVPSIKRGVHQWWTGCVSVVAGFSLRLIIGVYLLFKCMALFGNPARAEDWSWGSGPAFLKGGNDVEKGI